MSVNLSGFTIIDPITAPVVVAGTASGLLVHSAVYGYKISYVTNFGESLTSAAVVLTTSSTGSVNISAIPLSPDHNVFKRNIYRTAAGGTNYLLLACINDNLTAAFTDTIGDTTLGVVEPSVNSAHSVQTISGVIKTLRPSIRSIQSNITAGAGGLSTGAYQLTAEYNVVATVVNGNDSVKLPGLTPTLVGVYIRIRNASLNTCRIYPFNGQTINGGAVDGPIACYSSSLSINLVADTPTNWVVV